MSIDYNAISLEDLTKAIQSALSGNNQLIQQASTFLRTYVKYISSVPKLTDLLLNSPDESIRLYSTVLLRRSISTHFQNMQPNDQDQFKKMLLSKFNSQKSFLIQKNVAGLIGRIIPVVKLEEWKDLQIIFQSAIQSAPDSKLTLVLLNEMIGQFKPPQQVIQYMLKCLYHENLTEYALNCIHSFVQSENAVDDSIPKGIIQAWNIGKWDDDRTFIAIEIFCQLAFKKSQLKPEFIQWVVEKTVKNLEASQNIRVSGLDFLKDLSQNKFKSNILNSNDQLLKYTVETLCLMVCNPPKLNEEEQEDTDALDDIALYHIETYAQSIKQKKFYPLIFDIVIKLIESNDVNKMNAGFLILGTIARPCAQRIKRNLANPIMNKLIPKGLEHPSPQVRGAAINALIFFAEYLVPNIVDYHNAIVPSMVNFMNDSIQKVGEHALIALEILFENMEEDQIMKYLPDIVPIMYKIWSSPAASLTMKKTALGTIGSLINASEQKFQPYIEPAYNLAVDSMKLPDTIEGIYLKSQGITILGRLAFHFTKDEYKNKKEFFTSKIFPLLQPLYAILQNAKDPNIREGCFTFFYLLASSINHQFSVIFEKILVEVLKSCEHDPSIPAEKKGGFSLDEDSEPEDGYRLVNVRTTELDEKAAAIHSLGVLANACPLEFVPYFPQAYKILEEYYQHFFENIRIQCIFAYENLTLALIKSKNQGKIPQYKQGLPCIQRYPQALQTHFFQELIPRLVFYMTEQDDADVSACAIEALETLIKSIGPVVIDKSNDKISEAIIALLEGRDKFVDDDESEEQEQQDDGQTNEVVFSPLCDLIPAMAKALKTGFEPNFKAIFPSMMKYMQDDRQNVNDNIDIVGSFAQILHEIPSVIPEYQNQLLPQISKLRALNDDQLNRNICYCLGIMYEGSPQSMNPFLTTGINEIKNLYENSISPATKQNALAAIARIIMTYNPQLPLEILLATFIDSMPFKADEGEQKTLWRLILHLSNINGDVLRPHLKKILSLLQHDIQESKKYHIDKEPIKTQLIQFGNNLNALINA